MLTHQSEWKCMCIHGNLLLQKTVERYITFLPSGIVGHHNTTYSSLSTFNCDKNGGKVHLNWKNIASGKKNTFSWNFRRMFTMSYWFLSHKDISSLPFLLPLSLDQYIKCLVICQQNAVYCNMMFQCMKVGAVVDGGALI